MLRSLRLLMLLLAASLVMVVLTLGVWMRKSRYELTTPADGTVNRYSPAGNASHLQRISHSYDSAGPTNGRAERQLDPQNIYSSILSRTRLKIQEKRSEISEMLANKDGSEEIYIDAIVRPHAFLPTPTTNTIASVPSIVGKLSSSDISSRSQSAMISDNAPEVIPMWHSGDVIPGPASLRIPNVKVSSVDCTALFRNDEQEQSRAALFQSNYAKTPTSDSEYIQQARNCSSFTADRRYITQPVNLEEAEFPIAFTILMFKDVEQVERLLRAVYRPQNLYCLHVDWKSAQSTHAAIRAIAGCFENIFIIEPSVDVYWGSFSVLEPELKCMRELLRRDKKWKYFINLTGQEFPLKTNWQIVRILKAFNGSNNLEGTVKRRNLDRFESKPPAPFNITITKGSVHIVAVRGFVDFVVNDHRAMQFLDWVKDTYIPDETYFSSINHSPHLGAPGSYTGEPETDTASYRFMTRFKNWGDGPFNWPCRGHRVSMVCIFAVGDLPLLATRPELFANKFYINYQPLTLDCMEELHFKRLRDEVQAGSNAQFDTSDYSSLSFVSNHV